MKRKVLFYEKDTCTHWGREWMVRSLEIKVYWDDRVETRRDSTLREREKMVCTSESLSEWMNGNESWAPATHTPLLIPSSMASIHLVVWKEGFFPSIRFLWLCSKCVSESLGLGLCVFGQPAPLSLKAIHLPSHTNWIEQWAASSCLSFSFQIKDHFYSFGLCVWIINLECCSNRGSILLEALGDRDREREKERWRRRRKNNPKNESEW